MAVASIKPYKDQEVGRELITVTVDDGNANGETDVELNGIVKQVIFNIPALTGASTTAELLFHNEDDDEVYASGERAEGTKHTLNFERPMCGIVTFRVEQSASQSGSAAAHTITVMYV